MPSENTSLSPTTPSFYDDRVIRCTVVCLYFPLNHLGFTPGIEYQARTIVLSQDPQCADKDSLCAKWWFSNFIASRYLSITFQYLVDSRLRITEVGFSWYLVRAMGTGPHHTLLCFFCCLSPFCPWSVPEGSALYLPPWLLLQQLAYQQLEPHAPMAIPTGSGGMGGTEDKPGCSVALWPSICSPTCM